jgi:4-hydroxy-4-methyl-2-oxoglutarate aldolase
MFMISFKDDLEMLQFMKTKLYSAVLSDSLDQIGLYDQAMRTDIRPIYLDAVVVGRALTVLSIDVYERTEEPYKLEIEAVDSLKHGNILVASTGRSVRTCFWGELLSTAAQVRGAYGAVIDGYIRDTRQIINMQFPVFSTGMKPVDSNGRGIVADYNCAINCGDVIVGSGDIIFGDIDGIVVIPKQVEKDVIERALEKVDGENRTREELRQGKYLRDVYEKYGIL